MDFEIWKPEKQVIKFVWPHLKRYVVDLCPLLNQQGSCCWISSDACSCQRSITPLILDGVQKLAVSDWSEYMQCIVHVTQIYISW